MTYCLFIDNVVIKMATRLKSGDVMELCSYYDFMSKHSLAGATQHYWCQYISSSPDFKDSSQVLELNLKRGAILDDIILRGGTFSIHLNARRGNPRSHSAIMLIKWEGGSYLLNENQGFCNLKGKTCTANQIHQMILIKADKRLK